MAFATQTKMVIGYENKMTPDRVSSITLANFSANVAFPEDNLQYDDPWRMMKVTSAPSGGNPRMEITFSTPLAIDCFGIVNHNLFSQDYDGVVLEYWNGSSWALVGTPTPTAPKTDVNFLYRFGSQTSDQWAVEFTHSTAYTTFYIGALFFGKLYEVTTNPLDGLANAQLRSGLVIEQSAGGAQHVVSAPTKFTHSSEITFQRVALGQVQTIAEEIARKNQSQMIAIVQPHQVGSQFPTDIEHQFGYLTNVAVSPRSGSPHKADVVMTLAGAV